MVRKRLADDRFSEGTVDDHVLRGGRPVRIRRARSGIGPSDAARTVPPIASRSRVERSRATIHGWELRSTRGPDRCWRSLLPAR
jgi:hypothetical protein